MKHIEWLFFDIGGVLSDESKFTEWRIQNDLEILQKYHPELTRTNIDAIWEEASSIVGGLDDNIFTILLKDSERIEQAKSEIAKRKSEATPYSEQQRIRSEVKEVVAKLSEKYKLGIIANQHSSIKLKLEEAGVLQYFKNTDVSHDHQLDKPDLALFQAVFKQAGANPLHSVMIDDNIERGLAPAKKFGMTTVWYRLRERNVPDGIVDHIIKDLDELLNIL